MKKSEWNILKELRTYILFSRTKNTYKTVWGVKKKMIHEYVYMNNMDINNINNINTSYYYEYCLAVELHQETLSGHFSKP